MFYVLAMYVNYKLLLSHHNVLSFGIRVSLISKMTNEFFTAAWIHTYHCPSNKIFIICF